MPTLDPRKINKRLPSFQGKHYWVMALFHQVDPVSKEDIVHVDHENLIATHGPACFFCAKDYSLRESFEPCGGAHDL